MRIFLKIFIFFCKNELTSQKKDDRIEPSSRIDDRKYGNYYCKASSLKGGFSVQFYKSENFGGILETSESLFLSLDLFIKNHRSIATNTTKSIFYRKEYLNIVF